MPDHYDEEEKDYERNRRENRPDLKPTDFVERYKKNELGKESIDAMINGIADDWNNLDPRVKEFVSGTAKVIGDTYQDMRTISEEERLTYDPVKKVNAYATAGIVRGFELGGELLDATVGNVGRGIGWMAGLDPRANEALAIGAQFAITPQLPKAAKAFSKTQMARNMAMDAGMTMGAQYQFGKETVKTVKKGFKNIKKGYTENFSKDASQRVVNVVGEAIDSDSASFRDVYSLAQSINRKTDIGMQKSIKEAKLLIGIRNKGLLAEGTTQGSGSINQALARLQKIKKDRNIDPRLSNVVDPKDVPRTDPGMWMTAGRQAKPLAAKFFDDAGWIGGRLNLKSWRERPGDGKAIAELFLTAQGKGVVFKTEASKQNSFMSRVFGIGGAKQLLGLPEDAGNIFQAHHKTATKAVLTGQEGLVYDSPYYHEIQKVWEDLELTLGNNPDNIIGTLGLVQRDLDAPHSLVHKFLDSKMGPDGTAFWTPEKMNQIVIYDKDGNAIGHKNFKLRKKWTKEQALIFKEAVDLLKLAHEQYYLAKGVRPGPYLTAEPILDEDIVNAFINKLPPKYGTMTKKVNGKTVKAYNTSVIEKIAREIAEEKRIKPTISDVSIQDVMDKRLQGIVDTMYKFAVNEANGEEMLLDVIFNGLTTRQAVNKWKGNDPSITQLSIRFNKAIEQAKTTTGIKILNELYQKKYGEIPPATNFDYGRDD